MENIHQFTRMTATIIAWRCHNKHQFTRMAVTMIAQRCRRFFLPDSLKRLQCWPCEHCKAIDLHTLRNIFQILLNQPQIRLYLPFYGWFGSKQTSVWIKINRIIVNKIWYRVNLIRFRKKFLCQTVPTFIASTHNDLLLPLNVSQIELLCGSID